MVLDLKKLFPNSKFPTAEELKAKEDTFSIGDRVKVSNNIRCIQHGQTGTIVRIEPEDKYGWKSFVVKFDDEKYGAMGFNSGSIDKINEKRTIMKTAGNQKVTALKVNIAWQDDDGSLEDAEEYYVTDEFDRPSYVFVKVPVELIEEMRPNDLRDDLICELEDLYGGMIDDIAIINVPSKVMLPRAKTLVWTERGLVGA